MGRYIASRFAQALLNILFIATLVFGLVRLTGDPSKVLVPDEASVETEARMRKQLGLDHPIYYQYFLFMKGLATWDLGITFSDRRPVTHYFKVTLPATATLAGFALLIATAMGIPIGVFSAVYRDTWIDRFGKALAMLGQATPAFWLGIMLILVFGVYLGWLPVAQRAGLSSYVLPGFTMGWAAVAGIVRLTRSSMLDALESDYVLMARAKGAPERAVMWKHALRNALIPVITYMGLVVGGFMNGSVVVETVFAWPGVGKLAIDSVMMRDYPVVQATVIMIGVFFITINFIVDILYAYIDPRIKYR